jgi:hypothetical protein
MSQRDNPRLALNNFTAGARERQEANRARVAGHLDEIQGVVACNLGLFRNAAVGFIDWLDLFAWWKLQWFCADPRYNLLVGDLVGRFLLHLFV